MGRMFLTYILPLLLPLAVYLFWTWIVGRKTRKPEDPPFWYEGPYFWLIVAGFVLMLAVLAATAILSEGGAPDQEYVPSRTEDGHFVPGRAK